MRRWWRRAAAATAVDERLLPRVGAVVAIRAATGHRAWTSRVESVQGRTVTLVGPVGADRGAVLPASGSSVRVTWSDELGLVRIEGTATVPEPGVARWTVDVTAATREQRRGAFRLPVVIRGQLRQGNRRLEVRIRDVSERGVRCAAPADRAPGLGETVEVVLPLPGHDGIVATAQVVHVGEVNARREVRLGLGFLDDDVARADVLRRFVLRAQLGGTRRRHLRAVR